MNNFFLVHTDGTIEPYATVTDDAKVVMHVSEEKVKEQTAKNTQRFKHALEEVLLRRV